MSQIPAGGEPPIPAEPLTAMRQPVNLTTTPSPAATMPTVVHPHLQMSSQTHGHHQQKALQLPSQNTSFNQVPFQSVAPQQAKVAYYPQQSTSAPQSSVHQQPSSSQSANQNQQNRRQNQPHQEQWPPLPPPTNDIKQLINLLVPVLISRKRDYERLPGDKYQQEAMLIEGILQKKQRPSRGRCNPYDPHLRGPPRDDDDRGGGHGQRRFPNHSPVTAKRKEERRQTFAQRGGYRGGRQHENEWYDHDSTDEEMYGMWKDPDEVTIAQLAEQFGDLKASKSASFAHNEWSEGNSKMINIKQGKEADLQSGNQYDDYFRFPTSSGYGGGGGGGGDDDDYDDDYDDRRHNRRPRRNLGNTDDTYPPGTTPPNINTPAGEVPTIFVFPSMDEVKPPYALKHAMDGNVCGGTSEHDDYKLIKGVTKEINLDKCPAHMDEFLYFKRQINTFIEVTRAAISKKVTIYTMVAVLMLRTAKYHHIIKRLASRQGFYTSFRHFIRVFILEQWPNAKDRALHLSGFCKQRSQSIEMYFESFVAIYEEFGTSLDDHIIKFIDGLNNAQLRERVRCNDYQQKTLLTVREYAIRTWQNMEAEMACRNKSYFNKSTGNRTGNGFSRQQRGYSRGRGRGRGNSNFRGRGRGSSTQSIASIRAAPTGGRGRGRSKSVGRQGGRGAGRGAGNGRRTSSAPRRSASRGNAQGRGRQQSRSRSEGRERSSSASRYQGGARSASAGNRRSGTPHAKIAALDNGGKREEAIKKARKLGQKGCVGCMASSHQ